MKQLNSSENKKSSLSELNKSNLEINRGFEFILYGGKKKQVKPVSFVFDKIFNLFNREIGIYFEFSLSKRKSFDNDINKSTSHIDRGFELILSGGKRKRPKSFRLVLDKMISFFNKDINIHLDFYVDVKPKK